MERSSIERGFLVQVRLFRPKISEDAADAVVEVLRSGWLGLGPKTAEFEDAFAAYTQSNYCVAVNSCTSALHLALRILDLPPGSEVITTPITFVSTNHVILYEQLKPVFADIEPDTGNLDINSVAKLINPNTRAIILMHYGGYPCALDEFYALAKQHNLNIIEDCAHACGATYKGQKIGSVGDIHAFSFHAVKNLPMGDGGALTVRSEEHWRRLRCLRWMGIDKDTFERSEEATRKSYNWDYDVSEVGFKYHMNDIQAAIGLAQLGHLNEDNAKRRKMASIYRSELKNTPGVQLLNYSDDRESSYHLCCILAEERDALVDKLRDNGVGVGVHYKRNDCYPMYGRCDLPNAESFSSHVMSLPLHLYLTEDEIHYVCKLIQEGW